MSPIVSAKIVVALLAAFGIAANCGAQGKLPRASERCMAAVDFEEMLALTRQAVVINKNLGQALSATVEQPERFKPLIALFLQMQDTFHALTRVADASHSLKFCDSERCSDLARAKLQAQLDYLLDHHDKSIHNINRIMAVGTSPSLIVDGKESRDLLFKIDERIAVCRAQRSK